MDSRAIADLVYYLGRIANAVRLRHFPWYDPGYGFTDNKNIETISYLTRIRSEDDRRRVQFLLTEKARDILVNDPLGTYSRKNKLYFALRELGKVVRIGFLLNYTDDLELRQTITEDIPPGTYSLAVPLITVLFMASVMPPLFLPDGVNFEKLMRALIGITLWQSAYMAEVVRGGLQAIPKGQYEAASALGLGYWRKTGLVVLPQALTLVIPGIVNTFISLFKDTTLVLIIGLFDILGAVQSTITDPAWRNVTTEGYVFVAFCFWIFCFGMSRYSQNLERKLDTGHKS